MFFRFEARICRVSPAVPALKIRRLPAQTIDSKEATWTE